jgi:N-acetylmuramoyl-L-alanine amidase
MAARWVGLTLKKPRRARAAARRTTLGEAMHESVHALGALGFLGMAAAFNFAMYPEALANVVGIERQIDGFVPAEPSQGTVVAATIPREVDEEEVRLLAATAWGEARSEGEDGMRAVAHVMVNRVGDRFGDDLETVILAPKQFSVWNLGDPNRPLVRNPERYATGGVALETWESAQRIAREVLSGQSADPTQGALFYHTRAIRPYWSRYGQGRQVIGAHVFYRDVPDRAGNRRARFTRVSTEAPPAAERSGRRAGRVNGVIQTADAPAQTTSAAPPVVANAPSPDAAAEIAQWPTSTSGSSGTP